MLSVGKRNIGSDFDTFSEEQGRLKGTSVIADHILMRAFRSPSRNRYANLRIRNGRARVPYGGPEEAFLLMVRRPES